MDNISALLNYYIGNYAKKMGWTKDTVYSKKYRIGKFLSWSKVREFSQLTNEIIDEYFFMLCDKGLTPRSRNAEMAVLKAFLKYAKEKGCELKVDLTELARCKTDDPSRTAYTEDQVLSILESAETDIEYLIIALAYYCGLRRFEIARLKREDITGNVLYFQGKGGRKRKAYMSPFLADKVYKYMSKHNSEYVFKAKFESKNGVKCEHIHKNSVSEIAKRVAARAGIYDFHIHQLRYSLATTMDKRDVKLQHIQMALGHRDIRTTQKYIQRDFTDYMAPYDDCFSTINSL